MIKAAAFAIVCFASLASGQTCKRPYAPPKATFELCIPDGFSIPPQNAEVRGLSLNDAVSGKQRVGFTVRELNVKYGIDEYWSGTIALFNSSQTDRGLIDHGIFVTASGFRGFRFFSWYVPKLGDPKTYELYYVFPGHDGTLLTMEAILLSDDEETVALADSLLTTILIKP